MKCLPDDRCANEWKLFLDVRGEQASILQEAKIPGLYIWHNGKGASGEVSAVAAAYKLLGGGTLSYKEAGQIPSLEFTQLRDYQKQGVQALYAIMKRANGALMADDMGLGKTRQVITAASCITGRKLAVCPASVRLSWQCELQALGYDSTFVIDPAMHAKLKKGNFEKLLALKSAEWVVTSYDLAHKIFEAAFTAVPPSVLIMDEAHNLKGRGRDGKGNVRVKGLREISAYCRYKLAITGTPIWDKPRDLWMLFQLLGITSWRRWDFDVRYCGGRINQWGGMDNGGASNTDELKLRLKYYMVRRTKDEVASELPPKTRTVEWLDPVKEATDAWHASILKPGGSSLAVALQATHATKLARAVELAVQARQFLLFTHFRTHAHKLQADIEEEGVPCVCITGEDSPAARQALVDRATKEQIGVVATLDSMGVGVNMQGVASYGIMHAVDYVPNKLLQAEDRLHRLGQQNPVQWTYLAVRESADEQVIRKVVEKLDYWSQIIGQENNVLSLRNAMNDDGGNEESHDALMKELFEGLVA